MAEAVLGFVAELHASAWTVPAVVGDTVVATTAALLARRHPIGVLSAVGLLLVAFHLGGVYHRRAPLETHGMLWYPPRIAVSMMAATGILATADRVRHGWSGVENALWWAWVTMASLLLMRWAAWRMLVAARRRGLGLTPTLVVGSGPTRDGVATRLAATPELGLRPLELVLPPDASELGARLAAGQAGHVVLVPDDNHDPGIAACIAACHDRGVDCSLLPPLLEPWGDAARGTAVAGLPLVPVRRPVGDGRSMPGKRALDVLGAAALLLVTLPVTVPAAVAIKLSDGGPLFYRQERVGLGGRRFRIVKFRSMVVGADRMLEPLIAHNSADGLLFKMRDDPRITRVGRVLRRFAVDELPQLWNVVRGDMSLVGPRPLPVDPREFGVLDGQRHTVRPGMTGYWQTANGQAFTYQEMVRLDLAYIKNWSLWIDLVMLARTVPALLHPSRRQSF